MTEHEWQAHPEPVAPPLPGQEPHFPGGEPAGGPEARLVAWFADEAAAWSCVRDLESRGVTVRLETTTGQSGSAPGSRRPEADSGAGTTPAAEAPAYGSAALAERGMGPGAVLGATVGATAGFLAAQYLVPPVGSASAAGTMLTTLAGAGLGSFFGGLLDQGAAGGDRRGAGGRERPRVRLEARVPPVQVNAVLDLVSARGAEEVKLRPPGAAGGGPGEGSGRSAGPAEAGPDS